MIQLRPYQQTLIDGIRAQYRAGTRSVLAVAPTGAGKTVCFAYITQGAAAKGNRVLIMAHRVELIDQISDALKAFGVKHGFVAANYPSSPRTPVQVASIQTLIRRIPQCIPPDLIIVDEAHHATAKNTIGQILRAWPSARVLGVTATPLRLSGEGLGECFSAMVLGPTVAQLIDSGSLSPVRVYAPPTVDLGSLRISRGDFVTAELSQTMDKPKITGDAVDHYKRLAHGVAAVAFCVSVEHARHVAAQFTEAGFPSVHVDGGMDRHIRRAIIQEFRYGKIKVLTSCDLISEGFDCPGIVCGIMLRPTASLGLYMQQVGRCLRLAPGKQHAIILDHAGNTRRHGLPTEDREWSLEGVERSKRRTADEPVISVRVCPNCFGAEKAGRPACSNCGTPYPIAARKIAEVEGELEEVQATERRKEQGRATDLAALTELGKMRGYKSPHMWAQHVLQGRKRKGKAA